MLHHASLRFHVAGLAVLCLAALLQGNCRADEGSAPAPAARPDDDAGRPDSFRYYGPNGLWKSWNDGQRLGRDTWIFWAGGNQKFPRLTTVLAGQSPLPVSVDWFRIL